MRRIAPSLFLIFFLGSLILISCGSPKDQEEESNREPQQEIVETRFVRPAPVAQDYAGSEACRRCHSEIMKEYQSHSMSISMSLTSEYKIEDYPTLKPVPSETNASWVASRDGEKVTHSEIIKSTDGKKLLEHHENIEFTCGSGSNGCSYFVFDGGRMYQSPITWYSDERKWDLSPGYEVQNNMRFERMGSEGCLACHTGRINPVENERSTYNLEKPFHELAIGCERCHGPGKKHIDFHDSSRVDDQAVDPIVNPEKLSPALREAVCYQCHLGGSPRIPRYGRTEFDFRPGMHISDIWITFLKPGKTADDNISLVSQVEQMQLSQCFIKSKGELGCISCHDPHRLPAEEKRIDFYRNRCISCHPSGSEKKDCTLDLTERKKRSPRDSCIQCHMPKTKADDIAHLSLTDHRVQIPDDKFQLPREHSAGIRVWTDKEVPVHAIERAKAIAQAASASLSRHNAKTQNALVAQKALVALNAIHPTARDDLPLNDALAQLHFVKGDSRRAFQIWSDLLKRYPRDQFLLDQIAKSLHELGRYKDALPIYERLFSVNDRRTSVLIRHLDVCEKLKKTDSGIRVAQRIIEIEPGIKQVHQWLARAYEKKNNKQKSGHHQAFADSLPNN